MAAPLLSLRRAMALDLPTFVQTLNAAGLATRRPQYLPLTRTEQQNHGRRPPKRQLVQVIGTRCWMDFQLEAIQLAAR